MCREANVKGRVSMQKLGGFERVISGIMTLTTGVSMGDSPVVANAAPETRLFTVISTTSSHTVSVHIGQFLHKFGWTEVGTGSISTVQLPMSFSDTPNGYPLGLYWNYHNVLSKDIGLDIAPYLGQTVTVHIVPVKQIWGGPNRPDAIVIEQNGSIIGAWLRNGFSLGGSLRRHYFGDLIGLSWGKWLSKEGYGGYQRRENVISNNAAPEQVIRTYLYAVNHHDIFLAYELMSYRAQIDLMTPNANRLSRQLYLDGWNADPYHISNVVYWHVKSVEPSRWYLSAPDTKQSWYRMMPSTPYQHQGFTVSFTARYKKIIVAPNGPGGYEFDLIRETSKHSPWRIDGYGSGG